MKRHEPKGTNRNEEQQKMGMVRMMKDWLESAMEGGRKIGNVTLGEEPDRC